MYSLFLRISREGKKTEYGLWRQRSEWNGMKEMREWNNVKWSVMSVGGFRNNEWKRLDP